MNEEHLQRCSSAEWAEAVQKWIIPWVLDGIDLGDDVLEVGPGPGLTTDVLRTRVPRLTAVEIDQDLATSLAERLAGTNVEVLRADATRMPLAAERFSGAVCLSMLHHVPGVDKQNELFAEVHRVLRPGGLLAGEDSLDTSELRALHIDDTYIPVPPAHLESRLRNAGFTEVDVDTNDYSVRFRATKAQRAAQPPISSRQAASTSPSVGGQQDARERFLQYQSEHSCLRSRPRLSSCLRGRMSIHDP